MSQAHAPTNIKNEIFKLTNLLELFSVTPQQFFWKISENFILKMLEYKPETFNFNSFTV